jgi:hypothetical protein
MSNLDSDIAEWTFIIYLNGENKETQNIINNNKIKWLETAGSNKNLKIVYQYDALSSFDGIKRSIISNDHKSILIESLDEKSMGNPDTLSDFVIWSHENYPAKKYCLIIFSHGNGWREGFLKDETDLDDCLSMNELKNAMIKVKNNIGKNIDLVIFDACLMGMTEVFYQLRNTVDIVVGSEDVVYGNGFPYHMMLYELKNNVNCSANEVAIYSLDSYSSYYAHFSMAMGAFDLKCLTKEIIEKYLDNFAVELNNDFSDYENEILDAIENTQAFDIIYNGEKFVTNYKDLYDFAYEISIRINDNEIKESANELMNCLKNCTIKEIHDKKAGAHGISIYLPKTKKDYDSSYESMDLCKNTNWDIFINKCLNKNRLCQINYQGLIYKLMNFFLKDNILY